jgi:hypothetical protein
MILKDYFSTKTKLLRKGKMSRFIDDAIEAGFSMEQAKFMDECIAKYPHTHDIDEIEGLEEALESVEGEEEVDAED